MDKHLDARFDRVEKALANLIDSIAKFNPSEKGVEELASADKELNQSLRGLETHQKNHTRIQQLRDETAALDAQIKETTLTLWTMRKEITGTQATVYPPGFPKYNFTTADLLNYARRVSRNTVPPMSMIGESDDTSANASRQGTEQPSAAPSNPQTPVANSSFNGVAPNSAAPTPPVMNGESQLQVSFSSELQPSQQSGNTALPDGLREMTNLGDGNYFIPWPVDDVLRRGALAENSRLRNAGIDPRGYDPVEEERRKQEAEQARREEEEKARQAREEAERRAREERDRMNAERAARIQQTEEQRRGSVVAGAGPGAADGLPRKQFAFMDDLDDDDEDED